MGNITFAELIQIAKKHWKTLVLATLGMAVLAAALSYVTSSVTGPKRYAVATVYCAEHEISNDSGGWIGSVQVAYVANDARLVSTMDSVIEKGLAGTGISRDAITVTSPRPLESGNLFYSNCAFIVVESSDYERSATAANGIANATVDFLINDVGYSNVRLLQEAVPLSEFSVQLDLGVKESAGSDHYISKKAIVLGLGLGFCGGLFLIWCMELLGTTVRSRRDVEVGLALPVLAQVNKGNVAKRMRFVRSSLKTQWENASYTVLNLGKGGDAVEVARGFASSFAAARYRTLLLDADVHRHAPIDGAIPVEDMLDGDVASAIIPGGDDEYDSLILSGVESADLFASTAFAKQLDRLKSIYDIVIINSPSMRYDADAVMLVSCSPDVIATIEAGDSKSYELRSVLEHLGLVDARIHGVVLCD